MMPPAGKSDRKHGGDHRAAGEFGDRESSEPFAPLRLGTARRNAAVASRASWLAIR